MIKKMDISSDFQKIRDALQEKGGLSEEELMNVTKIPADKFNSLLDEMFSQSEIAMKNGKFLLLEKKKERKIEGKTAEKWFDLGYEEKDFGKKIEYYSKCLELDPKNAVAWNNKGDALRELGKYEEAIRCYDKLIAINMKDVVPWNKKGVTLGNLGRYVEAIRCFDKALKINFYDKEVKNNRKIAEEKLRVQKEEEQKRLWALNARNRKKVVEEKVRDEKSKKEQIRLRALSARNSAKLAIDNIREFDVPTKRLDELIEKSESAMQFDDYDNAIKFANQAEREALAEKERRIPEKERRIERRKAAKELVKSAQEAKNPEEVLEYFSKALEIDPNFGGAISGKKLAEEKLKEKRRKYPLSSLNEGKYEEAFEFFKEEEAEAIRLKETHEKTNFDDVIHQREDELNKEANRIMRSGGGVDEFKGYLEEVLVSMAEELLLPDKEKNVLWGSAYENLERGLPFEFSRERIEQLRHRYNRYTEIADFISTIKSEITKIKSSGVKIQNAEEILKNARKRLNEGNYEEAYHLSKEAERIAKETDTEFKEAKDWIKSADTTIKKIKEFCDVSEVDDILDKANSAFSGGIYEDAIKYAKQAEETTKKKREESKPEIEVDIPEKAFKSNYWESLNLIVINKGNAHAKEVKIFFSKEVEVKGLKELSVNSGEEEKLSIVLKPNELGEVPLDIKTSYKDADGKEYSAENLFMLNVTEEPPGKGEKYETPTEKKEVTFERAIYDPCKRDFVDGRLPRMKEWINRYDPDAYWFAMSIQNNTDRAIDEWGVELEFSSALKIKEAKIGGIEIEIPHEAHLNTFKISVPMEYGFVIPKGGSQRVYFKLRADKPKTTYEISGVFKSEVTGDVLIRAKEFMYLCDASVSPEAVKIELKKTFSEKDTARLALSFKTVQEIDRMCDQDAKTEEYLDKLLVLRNYTEVFSDKFTIHVDEFSRFMEQEQICYLDDEYKRKVRRFCTNLVDVWINEFLKG